MIRRFAIVFVWIVLAAVTAYAQQTPEAEQPPTQEPTTQPTPEQPTTGQEPPENRLVGGAKCALTTTSIGLST